jgi:hypothetical protein
MVGGVAGSGGTRRDAVGGVAGGQADRQEEQHGEDSVDKQALVTVSKKWKAPYRYSINTNTEAAHRSKTEAQHVLRRSLAKDKQVEARAKEHKLETSKAALYK